MIIIDDDDEKFIYSNYQTQLTSIINKSMQKINKK